MVCTRVSVWIILRWKSHTFGKHPSIKEEKALVGLGQLPSFSYKRLKNIFWLGMGTGSGFFSVFLGSKEIGTIFKSPSYEKGILMTSQRHFVRSRLKQVQAHKLDPLILSYFSMKLQCWEPACFFLPLYSHHCHSCLGWTFTILLPSTHLCQTLTKVAWNREKELGVTGFCQTDLCMRANKCVCKAQITCQSILRFIKLMWLHVFCAEMGHSWLIQNPPFFVRT